VFWALLLNPKHSEVPEDSKSPTLGVLGFTPTLGRSGVATITLNVFHLMVNVMATFEGLNVQQLGVKFISMGYIYCNNVFDIARVQLGVITQMKKNVIPFMICPLNQFGGLGLIKGKFGGSLGS